MGLTFCERSLFLLRGVNCVLFLRCVEMDITLTEHLPCEGVCQFMFMFVRMSTLYPVHLCKWLGQMSTSVVDF